MNPEEYLQDNYFKKNYKKIARSNNYVFFLCDIFSNGTNGWLLTTNISCKKMRLNNT